MAMSPQLTEVIKQFLENNHCAKIKTLSKMKKIVFALFVLIVTATSCVTSLQPLVTYKTAIADNRIEGTWRQDGQEYVVQNVFSSDFYKKNKKDLEKSRKENNGQLSERDKKDSILFSRSYMIKYSKVGIQYLLLGSLIKLNGRLFMNFTPVDIAIIDSTIKEPETDLSNRLNSYTIARVQFTNSSIMKLDFIDGGYLYDQIKAGRMKIKNEIDELYDTFLITASTTELQQFLEKYGDDNRFFNKENSVTLNRKS